MKVIEQEIHSLKNSISEMWALVHQQLYNAGEAMLTGDKELAYKVISRERRVNAFELKIDSDCEDIIALYAPVAIPQLVKETRVEEMLSELLSMISLTKEAFEKESSEIASRIFLKDNLIDEINHNSTAIIAKYIEEHKGSALAGLYMAGVIRKMERFGDHCTNIAEELIFYLDAKVMKHMGKTEQ